MANPIPDPVERPTLARWMWDRKLSAADGAEAIGVSAVQMRRYCLEFGHQDRQIPGEEVLARIVEWTGGEVTAEDFYPPHVRSGRQGSDEPVTVGGGA